jgi:caa(3)-type oxidase subunit IV
MSAAIGGVIDTRSISMSEQHDNGHAGPSFQTYMYVFYALSVCTALSFVVNFLLGHGFTSASIIMIVAVIKASLVAAIFMHLKFDFGKLYCIVVPVCILTFMMVIILSIDTTLAWHAYPGSSVPEIEQK